MNTGTILSNLTTLLSAMGGSARVQDTQQNMVQALAQDSKIAADIKKTLLTKKQRIRRHSFRCVRERYVYRIVDRLRRNSAIWESDLEAELADTLLEIRNLESVLALRESKEFNVLFDSRRKLISETLALASKRVDLYNNIEKNKQKILHLLYKEVLLVDKVLEEDLKIRALSETFNIPERIINQFMESGNLSKSVWGAATHGLFKFLGKL